MVNEINILSQNLPLMLRNLYGFDYEQAVKQRRKGLSSAKVSNTTGFI